MNTPAIRAACILGLSLVLAAAPAEAFWPSGRRPAGPITAGFDVGATRDLHNLVGRGEVELFETRVQQFASRNLQRAVQRREKQTGRKLGKQEIRKLHRMLAGYALRRGRVLLAAKVEEAADSPHEAPRRIGSKALREMILETWKVRRQSQGNWPPPREIDPKDMAEIRFDLQGWIAREYLRRLAPPMAAAILQGQPLASEARDAVRSEVINEAIETGVARVEEKVMNYDQDSRQLEKDVADLGVPPLNWRGLLGL